MKKYNCNDYFQYLYRSSLSTEIRDNRKSQIIECEHKFVLLKEGGWNSCGGFHSSDYEYEDDIVECVSCGLTNKYKDLECSLGHGVLSSLFPYSYTSVETLEFDVYSKDKDIELISDLVIDSRHTPLLYRIAKKMFPEEIDKILVEVMFRLNEIENIEEKMNMNTVDDAKDLMDRFYSLRGNVLVKK